MQPKRLVIQNFGPYIHETVDFDHFQETGLFLISGKTGAGKTTLFDSMSYALFGETSGQQRSGKEMRSTFASVGEETAVTFLFEHQGFFYEILRKPEQELPKKRGEGTKSQAMKVQLTVFNAQMEELRQYKKSSEVSAEIQSLLQLDSKQFFQLILLPQGEFRNFLVADSKDKEKLLRHLFQTQIYQRLNDWLKEQQKKAKSGLDEQLVKQGVLEQQFVWSSEAQPTAVSLKERLPLWAAELANQAVATDELETLWKKQKEHKLAIDAKLQAGRLLVRQLDEKKQLELVKERLEASKEQQETLQKRLDLLDWIADQKPLVDQMTEWQLEQVQTQEKQSALIGKREALAHQMTEWQSLRELASSKDAEVGTMKERLQQIAYQIPFATTLLDVTNELEVATKEQAKIESEQAGVLVAINELARQQQALSEAWVSDKDVFELERRVTAAKSHVDQFHLLDVQREELTEKSAQLTAQSEQLNRQLAELTSKQEQGQQDYLEAKSSFAHAMIVRLQRDLLPDTPCPVCGSLTHPAAHSESFDEEQVNVTRLEQALQEAEQAVTKLANEVGRLHSEQAYVLKEQQLVGERFEALDQVYHEQMNSFMLSFDLDQPMEDIRQFHDSFLQKYQEAQAMQSQQELQKDALAQRELALAQQQLTLEEAQRQVIVLRNRLEEKQATARKQVGDVTLDALSEERVLLTDKLQATERWLAEDRSRGEEQRLVLAGMVSTEAQIIEQLAKQEAMIRTLSAKVQASLDEQDSIHSVDEMRVYFDQLTERDSLRAQRATFEEENQYVTKKIAELVKLNEIDRPDLSALEAESQASESQMDALYKTFVQSQETMKKNEQLYEALVRQQEAYADQLDQLSELAQLSQVVNGENDDKLSLERYVLQQFLAEILDVANERFQRLSRGRYRFVIGDRVGSYSRKTGLEIDLYDDHTGETRRAQTLSGGESFIAALALALSLGDVIQARSGGITIDALFIDEGFGSLDEDALDVAIEALEMIEKEGRLIGIISHVRELKDRIGQQLVVNTRGNGTSFLEYR